MDFNTTITITIENGKEKSTHEFEREYLSITRATKLWIANKSDSESDFIETIKQVNKIDKNTKTVSYFTISTSEMTPVEKYRKYYVDKIDEKDQVITFAWIGY